MKRLSSSDSLIPICPTAKEKGMYGSGFPSILDGMDEDECGEDELCSGGSGGAQSGGEKKRRLSTEQVRALEKNFEVENKLDPERKVRLALELALQPRQVAVWFQNRRARWKTKQLERDYAALKASYDALLIDFDALRHDKQALLTEIKDLKAKMADDSSDVKEEDPVASESEIKPEEEDPQAALIYKDGSSDSDSSAVLNDDPSPHHLASSSTTSGIVSTNSLGFAANNSTSFSWSPFVNSETRSHKGGFGLGFSFQQQLLKAEEHVFLAGEEPCSSFFSDDQAPTLSWYCTDHWNWMDGGGDNNNSVKKEGPF